MKSFDQTLSADCGIPPRVDALPNVEIFGIKVHGPTLEQALAIIENWIEQPDGRCRQAIVTGFHGLWVAYDILEYRQLLNRADLFCPDGIAPIWLSRLHGRPSPQRTPGPALMEAFLRQAQRKGYSSYFYGDSADTLAALRARVGERFPGARVAGTFSPHFRKLTDAEEAEHVAAINESGADVLWVGLGLPRQDQWIARNLHRLKVKVALGVGCFSLSMPTKCQGRRNGSAKPASNGPLAAEPKKMWKRDFKDGRGFVVAALRDVILTRANQARR